MKRSLVLLSCITSTLACKPTSEARLEYYKEPKSFLKCFVDYITLEQSDDVAPSMNELVKVLTQLSETSLNKKYTNLLFPKREENIKGKNWFKLLDIPAGWDNVRIIAKSLKNEKLVEFVTKIKFDFIPTSFIQAVSLVCDTGGFEAYCDMREEYVRAQSRGWYSYEDVQKLVKDVVDADSNSFDSVVERLVYYPLAFTYYYNEKPVTQLIGEDADKFEMWHEIIPVSFFSLKQVDNTLECPLRMDKGRTNEFGHEEVAAFRLVNSKCFTNKEDSDAKLTESQISKIAKDILNSRMALHNTSLDISNLSPSNLEAKAQDYVSYIGAMVPLMQAAHYQIGYVCTLYELKSTPFLRSWNHRLTLPENLLMAFWNTGYDSHCSVKARQTYLYNYVQGYMKSEALAFPSTLIEKCYSDRFSFLQREHKAKKTENTDPNTISLQKATKNLDLEWQRSSHMCHPILSLGLFNYMEHDNALESLTPLLNYSRQRVFRMVMQLSDWERFLMNRHSMRVMRFFTAEELSLIFTKTKFLDTLLHGKALYFNLQELLELIYKAEELRGATRKTGELRGALRRENSPKLSLSDANEEKPYVSLQVLLFKHMSSRLSHKERERISQSEEIDFDIPYVKFVACFEQYLRPLVGKERADTFDFYFKDIGSEFYDELKKAKYC